MTSSPDPSRRNWLASTLGLAGGALLAPGISASRASRQQTPPAIRVESVRRVFHNGEHNAFTDLCRFQGRLYLTFRSCPDGHMVHPTSSILVLSSADDGKSWKEVHRFSVPKRDTRDPHFLEFRGRLFVYTGTWYSGATTLPRDQYDLNLHLGYAAWTPDGTSWHSPILMEGTFGHYIWRSAAYGDRAYLCGRRKPGFEVLAKGEGREVESLLLESDDGLTWRRSCQLRERDGDETAFLFEPDGRLVAVARGGGNTDAHLLRSPAPYTQMNAHALGRPIGGPLLARWGDRYLIGGRRTHPDRGPVTALSWLDGETLVEAVELPSGGDCSYPGFVPFSPTRGLLSYYSSHEKDDSGKPITAIYLAQLALDG